MNETVRAPEHDVRTDGDRGACARGDPAATPEPSPTERIEAAQHLPTTPPPPDEVASLCMEISERLHTAEPQTIRDAWAVLTGRGFAFTGTRDEFLTTIRTLRCEESGIPSVESLAKAAGLTVEELEARETADRKAVDPRNRLFNVGGTLIQGRDEAHRLTHAVQGIVAICEGFDPNVDGPVVPGQNLLTIQECARGVATDLEQLEADLQDGCAQLHDYHEERGGEPSTGDETDDGCAIAAVLSGVRLAKYEDLREGPLEEQMYPTLYHTVRELCEDEKVSVLAIAQALRLLSDAREGVPYRETLATVAAGDTEPAA